MSHVHPAAEALKGYAIDDISPEESSNLEAHLLECAACRQTLAHISPGGGWIGEERRRQRRTRVDETAQIKVLDSRVSGERSASARVVERSRRGMRLKCAREVVPGAIVRVGVPKQVVFGEVVHCIP